MKNPNIVLCIADQLRPFALGCCGDRGMRSPNIDRLAAEGARFETVVTNYPVCMTARLVLLSGQYNRTCTGGVANVCYESRPADYNMPEYPEKGRPHMENAARRVADNPIGRKAKEILTMLPQGDAVCVRTE